MTVLTPRSCALLIGVLAASITGSARADVTDAVVGRYEVTYQEVTSNCENTGMALLRSVFEISKRKAQSITVDIERMPKMVGSASKGGRIKATSKQGPTSIQGLDGRFSVAGTVNGEGLLSMVLVAEYYLNKKPYCTQSWNVSGKRAGEAPRAKKSADDETLPFARFVHDLEPTRWLPPAE